MKNIVVRKYSADDIPAMKDIWNEVVDEGVAFPQEDELTDGSAREFFAQQTYCGVAVDEDGKVKYFWIDTGLNTPPLRSIWTSLNRNTVSR